MERVSKNLKCSILVLRNQNLEKKYTSFLSQFTGSAHSLPPFAPVGKHKREAISDDVGGADDNYR
jgi:hypothetical protein